ncbi:gamma-glutamyltransferase family protein [Limnohabitans sp.]|uniref:gamma-glutamyltransferase family protein n=1 Tax=Limnohabitans sp. TaxID=1907725 RepID=UPI0037BF2E23
MTVLCAGLLVACGGSSVPAPSLVPVSTACEAPSDTGSVVVGSGLPGDPALPEPSSGFRLGMKPVLSKNYMVVTANPLATKAGCDVLKAGGSAADAAVAVQMVLGLVEPQSSGIGGGAFVVHYDAASKTVQTYDGRETAPAAATEDYLRFISATEQTSPLPNARRSGRAIGTPGTVRVLEVLHKDHGVKPWAGLFDSGVKLATDGFPISGRMADAIAGARNDLLQDPDAVAYFLNADLTSRALGTTIKNPDYAATLNTIASQGANGFYTGAIAQDIVDEIGRTAAGPNAATPGSALTPGATTLADLSGYTVKKRDPVCIDYRAYKVCGMGPPSSGAIAVSQTLGILENFSINTFGPTNVDLYGGKPSVLGVHLISEAQRLAYADRNKYVADTDFVPLPGNGVSSMLDKDYLRSRANLIRFDQSMGVAQPGSFANAMAMGQSAQEGKGTSHVSIVDAKGNVVSMTTTIESGMGAFRFVRGFLLNNELTDFSSTPSDASGPIANRVQGNKRPRSSMAPTMVFKRASDGSIDSLLMATGSPGGANIIQYVTKTVIGVVDWGLDAQQATALTNFGSSNSATTGIGGEHPNIDASNSGNNDALVIGLRNLGHTVSVSAQSSGTSTILRVNVDGKNLLQGGADPRREGLVLGDGER